MTLTTPNLLTLIRIGTVPLLVILLLFPGPAPSAAAAAVFFVATITDFLDGYIARNYGSGSTAGKLLDPLADKLLITAALIMLAGIPRAPRAPAWLVVILVSREILVTGLRAVAAAEGRIIAAAELGKYKMALDISMAEMMAMARSAGAPVPATMPGGGEGKGPADAASDPSSAGSVFTTVQQLGLKLESKKLPVEVLVVDKLEKAPTEN